MATHLFAIYAYQIGVGAGLLGQGATISLALFPVLFVIVVLQLWCIRRTVTTYRGVRPPCAMIDALKVPGTAPDAV